MTREQRIQRTKERRDKALRRYNAIRGKAIDAVGAAWDAVIRWDQAWVKAKEETCG